MSPSTKPIRFSYCFNGCPSKSVILLCILFTILTGSLITDSRAAFTLNWQRDYSAEGASFVNNSAFFCDGLSTVTNCSAGGGFGWGGSGGWGGSNDGSPFLQETLRLGGQTYFHLIVGDYTKDSMATEVFIHVSSGNLSQSGVTFSDSMANSSSDSRSFNSGDALSTDSNMNGNGSANPNSVIMHQIIKDSEISSEFLKDAFTQKPLISQTMSTPTIISDIKLDMRGSNYSQSAAIPLSLVTLTQTLPGVGGGDFNIHTQAQTPNITAGGYTYTTGSGPAGSAGKYNYTDAANNFQPMKVDYRIFCDPSQNSSSSGSDGWGGGGSSSSGPCAASSSGGGWGGGGW